jgi:hypothetical protein
MTIRLTANWNIDDGRAVWVQVAAAVFARQDSSVCRCARDT